MVGTAAGVMLLTQFAKVVLTSKVAADERLAYAVGSRIGKDLVGKVPPCLKQCFQQMLGTDPLMTHADGYGLRALQETLCAISKFLEIHALIPSFSNASLQMI